MHLREWLDRENLRATAFAARIGVAQPSISKWLAGKKTPGFEIQRRIYAETGGQVTPNDWVLRVTHEAS